MSLFGHKIGLITLHDTASDRKRSKKFALVRHVETRGQTSISDSAEKPPFQFVIDAKNGVATKITLQIERF